MFVLELRDTLSNEKLGYFAADDQEPVDIQNALVIETEAGAEREAALVTSMWPDTTAVAVPTS